MIELESLLQIVWEGLQIQGFFFQNPVGFWGLVLLPLLVVLWRRRQKNRLDGVIAFSLTSALRQVNEGEISGPRRRLRALFLALLPLGLQLLMLLSLVLAVTRPTVILKTPEQSVDMMLILDISLSMKATDILPSRMAAAQKSAIAFVESLPHDVRLGLVFFAGQSYLVSPVTSDHQQVKHLLASLKPDDLQPGTAIGNAIETGLQAFDVLDQEAFHNHQNSLNPNGSHHKPSPRRVMVLLSDGDQQSGYPWQQAAMHAKSKNIRIYTIGLGSEDGGTVEYQGQTFYVMLNDNTLTQIGEMTDGEYFRAFKANDVKTVYDAVGEKAIHWVTHHEDLAYILAGLAVLLLLLAVLI